MGNRGGKSARTWGDESPGWVENSPWEGHGIGMKLEKNWWKEAQWGNSVISWPHDPPGRGQKLAPDEKQHAPVLYTDSRFPLPLMLGGSRQVINLLFIFSEE